MDPSLLTTYLTTLFESPSFVAERYTDNQIAEATWFLFGCGSGFIGDMRRGAVQQDLQVRCVRSITTLYTCKRAMSSAVMRARIGTLRRRRR